jgi:hypothetical protein
MASTVQERHKIDSAEFQLAEKTDRDRPPSVGARSYPRADGRGSRTAATGWPKSGTARVHV